MGMDTAKEIALAYIGALVVIGRADGDLCEEELEWLRQVSRTRFELELDDEWLFFGGIASDTVDVAITRTPSSVRRRAYAARSAGSSSTSSTVFAFRSIRP